MNFNSIYTCTFLTQAAASLLLISSVCEAAGGTPEAAVRIVDRTQDSATYQRVVQFTNDVGATTLQTNQFKLLENGLHYLDDGEWKQSEDLIESFPDGAIARRGPNRTIFSPDLHADAVFDILTPDGTRLRGGIRQIQLTDLTTGKSTVLATVKAKAPAQLVPPNKIV